MKLNLFAYAKPAHDYEVGSADVVDGHKISLFSMDMDLKVHGYVYIAPATVEFEIPEGWDPRAQQIEALRAKKAELHKAFADSVMQIDRQINQLQAIEFTA